jgi:multiple sugar transport system permease protein
MPDIVSSPPPFRVRQSRFSSARTWRRLGLGLLFASPWLIGFLIFTLYPILASAYYSLHYYDLLNPPTWVGLGNYQQLSTDGLFQTSLQNTLWLVGVRMPLVLILGFSLALLLNHRLKGMAFFRTALYLPNLVPPVATAVLWLFILDPRNGFLQNLLSEFGVSGPNWLNDPAWTKPGLLLLELSGSGGVMIIFLAGLRGIPIHLYEAAQVDGAGTLARFRHVTLPMISPIILYSVVTGTIAAFQYFTQAFVLGGGSADDGNLGGPQQSLLFYGLYLYENAFGFLKMGYASAMAWLLFLLTGAVTAALFLISRKAVYYEGILR